MADFIFFFNQLAKIKEIGICGGYIIVKLVYLKLLLKFRKRVSDGFQINLYLLSNLKHNQYESK